MRASPRRPPWTTCRLGGRSPPHPRAPPQQHGSMWRPRPLASGRPKDEGFSPPARRRARARPRAAASHERRRAATAAARQPSYHRAGVRTPDLVADPRLVRASPAFGSLLGTELYGFDGPIIVEELLRERGVALTALVYPPLLEEESPLAPFPYPLPGTASTFERFGAVPASGRSLYRALSKGEHTLLFPGGGRAAG